MCNAYFHALDTLKEASELTNHEIILHIPPNTKPSEQRELKVIILKIEAENSQATGNTSVNKFSISLTQKLI
jgi:hypothetical protein